jgi:hypothetical protein
MYRRQERYWLVRQGHHGSTTDELRAEDFVCCEVPVERDTAMALEVFTSREGAEAELRGMERLAPYEYYPRAASKHRGFTEKKPDETASEGVVEIAVYEFVEILDGSGVPYVLIDPPPVDEPISERLCVEPASVFVEELRRLLLKVIKKDRV